MQAKPDRGRARSNEARRAQDAEFLAEEFELTEREAADLVSGDAEDAEDARSAVQHKRAARDPLDEAPAPEAPESEIATDNDEVRLKPVLRHRNRRTGAG